MNGPSDSFARDDVTRRRLRAVALLLIAFGALIFLFNSDIGVILWRVLLPVGLLALGLDLVTEGRQRRRIIPGAIVAIAVLLPLVGASQMLESRHARPDPPMRHAHAITDDIDRLNATLKLTAGSLRIAALDESHDRGIIAQIEPSLDMERAYRRDGRRGFLTLDPGPLHQGDYRLQLAPDVPLDLSIEMGAGDADPLDFEDMRLERLDLRLGAGSTSIQLPERGVMEINITSGAGGVAIDVPDDLEARVRITSQIGDVDIDDRFEQRDGAYVTPGYDSEARNRADITITASIGSISVE